MKSKVKEIQDHLTAINNAVSEIAEERQYQIDSLANFISWLESETGVHAYEREHLIKWLHDVQVGNWSS